MVARQAEDGARILQRGLAAYFESPVTAPQPEEIGLWVIDSNRPAMDVGGPTVQKISCLLITVEFRKIGDVMRLVGGDIVVFLAMHLYVFSRASLGCRDFPQPGELRLGLPFAEVRHETEQ